MMAKGKYQEWLTDEGLSRIGDWAESGLTDQQIAGNMGVSVSTLNEWKRKYPQIMDTLKKSKAVADQEVENALYQSALGYFIEEETRELCHNMTTNERELITTRKTRKWIPPSVTAQIFWLKNRDPEHWRDKVIQPDEHSQDRDINVCFIPPQLPPPPPPDISDRNDVVKYYEDAMRITPEMIDEWGN